METERDLFFLWHLEHLGVLTRTDGGWDAPLWDEAAGADPVTVALVDSGVDPGHPNLVAALTGPQVDFAPRLYGAVHAPAGEALAALTRARDPSPAVTKALVAEALADAEAHAAARGLDIDRLRTLEAEVQSEADPTDAATQFRAALRIPEAPLREPGLSGVDAAIAALGLPGDAGSKISARATRIGEGYATLDVEDPARFFGAHGTACAGLVGGRPASRAHEFYTALPYYGVNPHCRIRSYSTPYGHEIQPVTNALLAAYLSGAEVILIPRGVYDTASRAGLDVANARRGTRIDMVGATDEELVDEDQAVRHRLEAETGLFESLLAAISEHRYVILTSGNDGFADRLAYPASTLEAADTALIAGATNRRGFPSSYSNGEALGDTVINVVSDDGTVIDRDRVHLDTDTREGSDYDFAPHIPEGLENRYSPWAPLSLDVRGPWGYAASARLDPPEYDDGVDLGSLYTLFGGTSAASSILAGAVSLLIQSGRLPRTPSGGQAAVRNAASEAGLKLG